MTMLDETSKGTISSSFLNYVSSFVSSKKYCPPGDILAVGSNCILTNRILSANFKRNGKKVVSFAHGEDSIFTRDEPFVYYGELSFCDYYANYGKYIPDRLPLKPLFKPEILQRDARIVSFLYSSENKIRDYKIERDSRFLYIPTTMSDDSRYGPYRDMRQEVYEDWQSALLSSHPNIFFKAHPKMAYSKGRIQTLHPEKMVYGVLEDVILNYDFIILDYLSTASSLAMATNKPVFYFDVGLRNISPLAKELIKKRTHWLEINPEDFSGQIARAFETYNSTTVEKNYEYIETFCLGGNPKSEVEVLNDLLRKL